MARPRVVEIDVEVDLDDEPDDDQWRQIKIELHLVGIDGSRLRVTVPVPETSEVEMWTTALAAVGRLEVTVNPPLKIVGRARVGRSEAWVKKPKKAKV